MQHWNYLYPLGALGIGFANTLFNQWIVYFHSQTTAQQMGAWIGSILMINYLFQGFFNPILGYIGDSIRHPWGRRRLFLLLGSIPLALAFWGLWNQPQMPWSILFICSYGLLFVLVVQPYVSLLPALAPTQVQRVKFSLAGGICSLLATGAALLLGPIILAQSSFAAFGQWGALLLIATLFLPALGFKELPIQEPSASISARDFLSQMVSLWKMPALRGFVLANGCIVCVVIALTLVSPFISEALLGQTRNYTVVLNGCTLAGIMAAIIGVAIKGKQMAFLRVLRSLLLLNGVLIFTLLAISILMPLPLFSWWVAFFSIGTLLLVAMMSPTLVLSELSDRDGLQREGLIFGLNGLVMNLGNAFAALTIALLLNLGHTAANPSGVYWVLAFAAGVALLAAAILTPTLRHMYGQAGS